jgi:hypothetical protein
LAPLVWVADRGTPTVYPVNSLFVIVPYKHEGMWVFDDSRVGLSREPFIAGIDTMIDKIVTKIRDADQGCRAIRLALHCFPATQKNWSGVGKNQAGSGTTTTTARWKAGLARPC